MVAQTQQPLSRQSLADLTERAHAALHKPIRRSTVWRILDADALKPWQYEYWIFPREPQFAEKAGPILDLYAGLWRGQPLGPKDHILSSDEKTSIQARIRCHASLEPARGVPGVWSPNTSVAAPCNTWQLGMSGVVTSWGAVNCTRASTPSVDWSRK